MSGIAGMECLLIAAMGFVILAAGIAIRLVLIPKKNSQPSSDKPAERPKKSSKRWIAYIVMAIILSFWSGAIALFFLLVLWIILQNPSGDMHAEVGKTEKSVARRVYTWLFVSSIFTIPFFIYLLLETFSDFSSSNTLALAALIPLLLHLPLLLGLTSKSIFVYRHTQQGIILIALRAVVAAIALRIGEYPYEGVWLFLLGNGSLWLFGSIWGWVQINRGDCWWMKQRGDVTSALGESKSSPKMQSPIRLTPEECLESSKSFLKRQLRNSAREYALEAFRRGNYEIKHQAIRVLDDMQEVEYF